MNPERPDFDLSPPERIRFVRDSLIIWMKNNQIAMFEISRAMVMLMRETDEQRRADALQARTH